MDGALPGLVAGLVSAPVIAVPTSVGYGADRHPMGTGLEVRLAGVDNAYRKISTSPQSAA